MNIFYLHENPERAAEYHYNKHVIKMVIETAQMLCTAHHVCGDGDVPYRKTHPNHPTTQWVRASKKHYQWAYRFMLALGNEYTKRYGKVHMTIQKCKEPLKRIPSGITANTWVEPPQAMPDEFRNENTIQAYWDYYTIGKKHLKDEV